MKSKLSLLIMGIGILLLTTGMMGGCGESVSESRTYYSPNWTPDGRIIAYKEVITTRKTWGWENPITEYKTYITTMSSDGTNEVDLFEVSGFGQEIVCSTDGKKIGYVTSGLGYLAICNYDGTGKVTIEGVSRVEYFDWSPDSTKIVYSDSNRELRIVNVDGTNNTQIATSAEEVAWRIGDKISFSFADPESSKVYVINSDGSSKQVVASIGLKPQKTQTGKIIYRGYGSQVESVKVDGSDKQTLFNNYPVVSLKLSFDDTKIVGGDLDQQDIVGIWVVNVDGTGAKRLR